MVPNPGQLSVPSIHVQIVHIEGPRKGEIDEFDQPTITIGRHPSSDVRFERDLRIVSRQHAEIKREGNRFLLLNHSANGCFVNGQPLDSGYLKQGDVITFAEGGPKVSFLYSVRSAPRPSSPPPPPPRRPAPAPPAPPKNRPAPSSAGAAAVGPFTIQYGTNIRSFKAGSVKLGKDSGCDFVLDHPKVFGHHAEVHYRDDQYVLVDLTSSGAVYLNGQPLTHETRLQDNDVVQLGDGGPKLRYLGTGRFAELIE